MSDEKIKLKLKDWLFNAGLLGFINILGEEAKNSGELEIDDEKRDESVKLTDFREHIQQCVLTWARTAVFYGVGSFTQ